MRYTPIHAILSDADLKAARKRDDAELCRLTGEIRVIRERKKILDLEAFRRLHTDRIDGIVAAIKADPKLRASLEGLRNSHTARTRGPREWDHPGLQAWQTIVGPARHRACGPSWHSPSEGKLIEIVLALIPAGSA